RGAPWRLCRRSPAAAPIPRAMRLPTVTVTSARPSWSREAPRLTKRKRACTQPAAYYAARLQKKYNRIETSLLRERLRHAETAAPRDGIERMPRAEANAHILGFVEPGTATGDVTAAIAGHPGAA